MQRCRQKISRSVGVQILSSRSAVARYKKSVVSRKKFVVAEGDNESEQSSFVRSKTKDGSRTLASRRNGFMGRLHMYMVDCLFPRMFSKQAFKIAELKR